MEILLIRIMRLEQMKMIIGFRDLLEFVNNEDLALHYDMKKVDNIKQLKNGDVVLEDND